MTTTKESFTTKIFGQLERIELVFLAGAAIGLLLRFISFDAANLITLSLIGLAIVFFLSAYRPSELVKNENEKLGFTDLLFSTMAPKILWISCSVSTIGLSFYLMGMKGYQQMLQIGSLSLAVGSLAIAAGMAMQVKHIEKVIPILYRAVPLMLIGFYLLWASIK